MNLQWQCHTFDELSLKAFYACMMLRENVFVVEQNCPYQDADGSDQDALHLRAYQGTQLAAYARIFPPQQGKAKIGRVVVALQFRGQGLGRELMLKAIAQCQTRWPNACIDISAQAHLTPFYTSLDFVAYGEGYLEDDIPHQAMQLKAQLVP